MSVAASRVLLGLHYLSDVLAGIVIGCAVGIAAFSVLGRVYNSRMSEYSHVAERCLCRLLSGTLRHGERKKLPSGEASNDAVPLNGTVLDSEQLKQIFGSDFDNGTP